MNSIAVLFGRLLIISLILFIHCLKVNSKVCYGNHVIKNNSDEFRRIANCTQIVGYLHIVLFDRDVNTRKRMESISLPNLEEITDYLLIYRIRNVVTLDWFPNLKAIRGNHTFEGNALVIQDMQDLRRVDFHSLKHVRGGVRLEQVNKLCFAHTSDYRILAEAIKKNSIKYEESLQLLPGFKFSAKECVKGLGCKKHPTFLQVEWNYTSVINNKTIDWFTLDLIEYEDLELLYKNSEKNNCPLGGTDIIEGQGLDEYDRCEMDFEMNPPPHPLVVDTSKESKNDQDDYQAIGFLPFNIQLNPNPISGKNQYFVFSSVDQVIDENHFFGKVVNAAYKSSEPSDESDKNKIPPKVQKRTPFDPKIYQIYGLFRFKSTGNETHYRWNTAIKHFRNYYLVVRACILGNPSCGVVAHSRLKTPPLETADDIDEQSVKFEVNQTSVVINWSEPIKPNGAIVSYQIHLQESLNKTNKKTFCINREHFRALNHIFTINGLAEETQYSFRLRATSMNGPSKKWTKDFNLNTTICIADGTDDPNRSPIIYMTVGLTSLLVAFLFTATICYLKAPKRHNSQLDIISVNPEYERYTVDPEWEIKKADIQLFHMLGDGAFGRVYYGELKKGNKIIKCAVKTLTPNPRSSQRENILKEANIMKSFVDCNHIVRFIGIVSIDNPVLVLMEYMVNGDLKTYLRSNRADNDENPNPRVPTWNRIFQMAIEIADGMAYLSARKFVHRDLAARNCMVADDLTVKIGDFGMTRDIYDNDYYRKRDSCLIPVRWMSPEALKDGVFTTYSDIWAYGVVLWEMVTMGAQPYQGYSNESVFQSVIRGVRLTEPDNCPKKLWRIMQFCWRKNPRTRPSFSEITEYLLPSANQSFREICYYLNRKPFDKKHQSLKNILYGLIPTHKILLNDVKQKQNELESDNGQTYCQMEPQIQRKLILSANEYTENEVEVLNKKNEINAKNVEPFVDEKTNSLIICEKQMTDQTIHCNNETILCV